MTAPHEITGPQGRTLAGKGETPSHVSPTIPKLRPVTTPIADVTDETQFPEIAAALRYARNPCPDCGAELHRWYSRQMGTRVEQCDGCGFIHEKEVS